MRKLSKIFYSTIVALGLSLINILHKKVGGFVGGSYSDPHSYEELIEMIPELISFFVFSFIVLLYFFLVRKEVLFVCPKCGDKFTTTNPQAAYCLDCDMKMEKVKK